MINEELELSEIWHDFSNNCSFERDVSAVVQSFSKYELHQNNSFDSTIQLENFYIKVDYIPLIENNSFYDHCLSVIDNSSPVFIRSLFGIDSSFFVISLEFNGNMNHRYVVGVMSNAFHELKMEIPFFVRDGLEIFHSYTGKYNKKEIQTIFTSRCEQNNPSNSSFAAIIDLFLNSFSVPVINICYSSKIVYSWINDSSTEQVSFMFEWPKSPIEMAPKQLDYHEAVHSLIVIDYFLENKIINLSNIIEAVFSKEQHTRPFLLKEESIKESISMINSSPFGSTLSQLSDMIMDENFFGYWNGFVSKLRELCDHQEPLSYHVNTPNENDCLFQQKLDMLNLILLNGENSYPHHMTSDDRECINRIVSKLSSKYSVQNKIESFVELIIRHKREKKEIKDLNRYSKSEKLFIEELFGQIPDMLFDYHTQIELIIDYFNRLSRFDIYKELFFIYCSNKLSIMMQNIHINPTVNDSFDLIISKFNAYKQISSMLPFSDFVKKGQKLLNLIEEMSHKLSFYYDISDVSFDCCPFIDILFRNKYYVASTHEEQQLFCSMINEMESNNFIFNREVQVVLSCSYSNNNVFIEHRYSVFNNSVNTVVGSSTTEMPEKKTKARKKKN